MSRYTYYHTTVILTMFSNNIRATTLRCYSQLHRQQVLESGRVHQRAKSYNPLFREATQSPGGERQDINWITGHYKYGARTVLR